VEVLKSDLFLLNENAIHEAQRAFLQKLKEKRSESSKDSKKYHDSDKDKSKDKSKKKDKSDSDKNKRSWLRTGLTVRIISKSFAKGNYYLKKANIVDVITHNRCTVQFLDSDKLEEGMYINYYISYDRLDINNSL
jgi:hypothetical protein